MNIPNRNCLICGVEYSPTSQRQKYCKNCGRRGFGTCDVCGKVFKRKGNTTGRFCSADCWYAFAASEETKRRACPVCEKVFKPKYAEQKSCSRECANVLQKRERGRKPRICPVCGKEFDNRHLGQYACSRKCAGQLRRVPRNEFCERCGKPLPFDRFQERRFCSRACISLPIGSRRTSGSGYVMLKVGSDYPSANRSGWMLEHRYVMEQHLGRQLDQVETVHHKNGDRSDNSLGNLELRIGKHGNGQMLSDIVEEILSQSEITSLDTQTQHSIRAAIGRVLIERKE